MGENKTKNCKIVATYFGIRRHYPYDCDDTIETLKDSIKNEMEVDPGVDNLDIIFINHDCGVEKGNKFLQSIDGKKVFCGKIRVITRDWDEGKGFVGYDMVSTIYDVKHQEIWALRVAQVAFFIPILIWGYRKYLKRFNRIISDSIELIKRKKLYCAGGMMGLTTQKNLKMVLDKCGRLPHPKASNPQYKERFKHLPKTYKDYRMVLYYVKTFFYYNKYITWYFLYAILGEIEFTRIYYDLGLRIVSYPDYKQLIYSYKRKRFK